MNQKLFSLVTGLIFLVVALVHLLRLVLEWQVTLAGRDVPMWVSWAALVIAGFLAFQGFRLAKSVS
jgi:hypothetical protein